MSRVLDATQARSIILLGAPDGIGLSGWAGSPGSVHTGLTHHQASHVRRTPATPPEQPNYLDRHGATRSNRGPVCQAGAMTLDLDRLWDFEDPAGSERRLRAASRDTDARGRRVLRTQVARSLGLQGRYEEAHAELDEVGGEGADPDPEVAVRVELERGRLLRSAGRHGEAAPHFAAAERRATEAGLDRLRVDAVHMQALDVEPTEQIRINEQALEIARASSSPAARNWDAPLLNNIGMARHDLADLEGALEAFQQALAARERIGSPRQTQIARWMVAWTLRLLGRNEEALVIQRAIKAELVASGGEDRYVDEELALLEATVE